MKLNRGKAKWGELLIWIWNIEFRLISRSDGIVLMRYLVRKLYYFCKGKLYDVIVV